MAVSDVLLTDCLLTTELLAAFVVPLQRCLEVAARDKTYLTFWIKLLHTAIIKLYLNLRLAS